MAFRLSWEPRGVVIHFSGRISIRDIVDASVAYAGDVRFDELRYVLADYTEIEGCDATPGEIDDVWALDVGAKASNSGIRKAIVTRNPEVIALARRYRSAPDPAFPIAIFGHRTAARAWLQAGQAEPAN